MGRAKLYSVEFRISGLMAILLKPLGSLMFEDMNIGDNSIPHCNRKIYTVINTNDLHTNKGNPTSRMGCSHTCEINFPLRHLS
jgi:hypothetical protein